MINDVYLFITLAAIIAIVFSYKIWTNKKMCSTEKSTISLILLPMVSIFGGFIIFFNIRFLDSKTTESYKPLCYIASIKNNNETSGNFTLGCGTIKETEYYHYFYKTLNGGYARGKKNVNRTVIIESDTQRPHVEVLTTSYKSKSGWFKYHDETQNDFKIVVPKGTIVTKFQLY